MIPVFLDTVGLIGVWDRSDQWHVAANVAYANLISSRRRIVTTTLVMVECGNTAARRPYRRDVCQLRETLGLREDLIAPKASDWDLAWQAYERGEAAQAGIVDHVSFAVMRRLGLTDAFTNDIHFRAAGFVTLF